jgi:hypothetical protein
MISACLSFCICLSLINYLEHCTLLYKVDRYIDDQKIEYGLRRLHPIECEWKLQDHYKRRSNIVISDMDTINACDRPLIKLLRSYCWEWDCQSIIFEKFQVRFLLKIN